MILRWLGLMLVLFASSFMTWSDGTPDAGMRDASPPGLAHAAAAQDFRQRHAGFGVACTTCHGDDLAAPTTPSPVQCLTCHESHDAVAALTAGIVPNPHHSHMGKVACTDCHSEHGTSRLSCNQCHVFEMEVP